MRRGEFFETATIEVAARARICNGPAAERREAGAENHSSIEQFRIRDALAQAAPLLEVRQYSRSVRWPARVRRLCLRACRPQFVIAAPGLAQDVAGGNHPPCPAGTACRRVGGIFQTSTRPASTVAQADRTHWLRIQTAARSIDASGTLRPLRACLVITASVTIDDEAGELRWEGKLSSPSREGSASSTMSRARAPTVISTASSCDRIEEMKPRQAAGIGQAARQVPSTMSTVRRKTASLSSRLELRV